MEQTQDKSKELFTSLTLIDNVHFHGNTTGNQPVSIDYIPPIGNNQGYTSLELLLLSLSSCMGTALLVLLRRMNKTITGFSVESKGIRKTTHPTAFSHIDMEIKIKSPDVNNEDLNKVLKLAEESLCPVYSMLKGNVDINTTFIVQL